MQAGVAECLGKHCLFFFLSSVCNVWLSLCAQHLSASPEYSKAIKQQPSLRSRSDRMCVMRMVCTKSASMVHINRLFRQWISRREMDVVKVSPYGDASSLRESQPESLLRRGIFLCFIYQQLVCNRAIGSHACSKVWAPWLWDMIDVFGQVRQVEMCQKISWVSWHFLQ